jgi:hypothetical protein
MRHVFATRAALFGGALGLVCFAGAARAQNLLTNGTLESPDLGGVEDPNSVPTGWTLAEGPDGAAGPTNSAQINHFGLSHDSGDQALWYRSFQGGLSPNDPPTVFARLSQTRPGSAGQPYTFRGWALFETNYPGGVPGDPTDTFFRMEFLNAASAVLSTVQVELLADGQVNGAGWQQHTLFGVSPAGTTQVRVTSAMENGHVVTANPQSAFVDDFSLTVPEPASAGLLALSGVGLVARRHRRRA